MLHIQMALSAPTKDVECIETCREQLMKWRWWYPLTQKDVTSGWSLTSPHNIN